MKVPFPANNQNNSKILNSITNTTRNTTPSPIATRPLCEPKSVLDLCRSPSPVPDHQKTTADIIAAVCSDNNNPLQLDDDHVLINQHLDDWDSLMRELGLHDDCAPLSKPIINPQTQTHYSSLPEFPFVATSFDNSTHQFAPIDNYNVPLSFDDLNNVEGFDYVDELIQLAECLETNSLQLCHVILARLHQTLKSPTGKPLQRAAFYFKEAIQSLLSGSTRPVNSQNIIQTIKAHKIFSTISPIPCFASFTANQAVLEATNGSTHVHVIDFDIGHGGHWASFMKEHSNLRVFRISAAVPENYVIESRLIKENLTQFALELNLKFDIEFVTTQSFKYLSFKSMKFIDGEKLAVLLSPAIFRHVGGTGFLTDLRRVSPHVIVHVDTEGELGSGTTSSWRQAMIDGLEFYSTLMESLDQAAVNFNGGDHDCDWIGMIEKYVVYPKIVEGVEAAAAPGRRGVTWREAMVAAGLRQVGPSRFSDFQAECLLRRVQVRGFHVVKRQAEMLLCWHDRPLAATSAWRC